MKFKASHSEHNTSLAEINIVPMVDIMLVLLIIFMVTAPMMKEGIDINLPEVSAGSIEGKSDDLILNIDQDGRIFLGEDTGNSYSIVTIEDKLKDVTATDDESKPKKAVYLKADQGVKYGYVVAVMAACQRVGIEKIGMMTEPVDTRNK